MKYNPSYQDEPNPNQTEEDHPILEFLKLSLAVVIVGLVMGIAVLYLGEKLALKVSVEQEHKLFSNLSWGIPHQPSAELDSLLAKLFPHLKESLKVGVWCTSQPNAVAIPGGQILITEGLLKLLTTENALAFVVGHEVGHFLQRDHLRLLGRRLGLGFFLSIVGMAGPSSQIFQLGGSFFERSYQREQEIGADLIAAEVVRDYYGGIEGAGEFFEKILKEEGKGFLGQSFFETHPQTKERLRLFEESQTAQGTVVIVPLEFKTTCGASN